MLPSSDCRLPHYVWRDVREPHTGKLLFRYCPRRHIIEIQVRGVKTVVDLMQYNDDNVESKQQV
jgi:hypothetical protein